MADASFETPEPAALAEWPADGEARVVLVDNRGDQAEVVLDVNGDCRYWVYLRRDERGWVEVSSAAVRTLNTDANASGERHRTAVGSTLATPPARGPGEVEPHRSKPLSQVRAEIEIDRVRRGPL